MILECLIGIFKVYNFLYFTTVSNCLCCILFGYLSIKTLKDIFKKGIKGSTSVHTNIKGSVMLSIILTMIVYNFVLIPYALDADPTSNLNLTAVALHYIVPALTISDWLLFDPKKRFKIYEPIVWTSIPVIYIIFDYIQAYFSIAENANANLNKFIYVFLDYETLGTYSVLANILKISMVYILIGFFIYGIDRIKIQNNEKISKKYRLIKISNVK